MTALICYNSTKRHAETKGSLNLVDLAYMYWSPVQLACCFIWNFSVLLGKSVTALMCHGSTRNASVLSRNLRSSIMICTGPLGTPPRVCGVLYTWRLGFKKDCWRSNRPSAAVRHFSVLLRLACCFNYRAPSQTKSSEDYRC